MRRGKFQPFDLQRVHMVARLLRRQGDDKPGECPLPDQRLRRAEQRNGFNSADQARRVLRQRLDRQCAVVRPAKGKGV